MFVCVHVCMRVCMYVCMCVYACMCVCVFVCMRVCAYKYVCMYVDLSVGRSVSLSVCLSGCLPVCLCVSLSVCLPACLSVYLPVCLYVCLFVCMYVCVYVCVCRGCGCCRQRGRLTGGGWQGWLQRGHNSTVPSSLDMALALLDHRFCKDRFWAEPQRESCAGGTLASVLPRGGARRLTLARGCLAAECASSHPSFGIPLVRRAPRWLEGLGGCVDIACSARPS